MSCSTVLGYRLLNPAESGFLKSADSAKVSSELKSELTARCVKILCQIVLSFAKRTSAGFLGGLVFETNSISVVVRSGVRGERSNTSAPDLNTEKRLTRASAGTSN